MQPQPILPAGCPGHISCPSREKGTKAWRARCAQGPAAQRQGSGWGRGGSLVAQGSCWVLQCSGSRAPDAGSSPTLQSVPHPFPGSAPGKVPHFPRTAPYSTHWYPHSAPARPMALTQKPQIFSESKQPVPWEQRVEGKGRWMSDCHSCRGGCRPGPPSPTPPNSQNPKS